MHGAWPAAVHPWHSRCALAEPFKSIRAFKVVKHGIDMISARF